MCLFICIAGPFSYTSCMVSLEWREGYHAFSRSPKYVLLLTQIPKDSLCLFLELTFSQLKTTWQAPTCVQLCAGSWGHDSCHLPICATAACPVSPGPESRAATVDQSPRSTYVHVNLSFNSYDSWTWCVSYIFPVFIKICMGLPQWLKW